MGRLDNKVAFITGAARGQGRSHALRLAQEGADVIAIDICRQIDGLGYKLANPDDLATTVAEVEALDRRIIAAEIDVRDAQSVQAFVARSAAELGGVDIVIANAAIASVGRAQGCTEDELFSAIIEVNLTGVWNTVSAAAPIMIEQGRGGAIVITSSTQGLTGRGGNGTGGVSGYCAAKHGVVGLMRSFSHWLAPHNIRVNTIHPTGVNTPMINNDAMAAALNDPRLADMAQNLLPTAITEPADISNAVAWLGSDEARYVTGVTLPVDAGFAAR
jgi:SDR family mycofactocin-dependent oxidoreductase